MVQTNPNHWRYSVFAKGKEIALVHGVRSLGKIFGYPTSDASDKFYGISPGKTVTFSVVGRRKRKKKNTRLISERLTANGVRVDFNITVKGVPKSQKIQKEWHDTTILPLKMVQGGKDWKKNTGKMSVILLDNKLLAVFGKHDLIKVVTRDAAFRTSAPKNAQGKKLRTSFGTVVWRPYKESDGKERITELGKLHFTGWHRWITKETYENTTFSVKPNGRHEPNVAELEAAHKKSKVRFAKK